MINSLDFVDEVTVGFSEPLQVTAFHSQRELFVLPHRTMLNLIHLVELALEQDEISTRLRLFVHQVVLELFECVHNFEEVAVV